MIILGTGIVLYKNNTGIFDSEGKELKLYATQQKDGWGYRIALAEKNLILQDHIPAISGQQPFSSEADALKTGTLVLHKIQSGKLPSVTLHELDSLGIRHQ